jgi:membrane-bound inhibitor of C-type lysozyme
VSYFTPRALGSDLCSLWLQCLRHCYQPKGRFHDIETHSNRPLPHWDILGCFANNQVTFQCDNGKMLTITYISGNNYRSAKLVFVGTNRSIMLENQGAASGTYYAGGGWGFIEHQDEFALVDDTSKPSRSFSCHEVRTK